MDVNVLIDAIVRQTTVLIAQLATAAGGRAPLAHTANQVFLDLVRELKEQGLGNKVIADMFGMALRTYHAKVRRLSESGTFRGRSLWSATLEYIQENSTVRQSDLLRRFRNDDEASVRAVLADLVDSGMIFRSGRGALTTFRAATPEEYKFAQRDDTGEAAANLVWVAVNRFGPVDENAIATAVPFERAELSVALDRLVADGRIQRQEIDGIIRYTSDHCVVPFGTSAGWEAAVFDHYQALVTAMCTKLRTGVTAAAPDDRIGGSTYGLVVWDGHPHQEEVFSLLSELRTTASRLRAKVSSYNADHVAPNGVETRVIAYVGQTVLESDRTPEKPE